jgi:hypothetical protein
VDYWFLDEVDKKTIKPPLSTAFGGTQNPYLGDGSLVVHAVFSSESMEAIRYSDFGMLLAPPKGTFNGGMRLSPHTITEGQFLANFGQNS